MQSGNTILAAVARFAPEHLRQALRALGDKVRAHHITAMRRHRALRPAKRIQYARCDIPNRWAESAGHIRAIPVGSILCSRNAH
jgi:hypothetical protein